MAHPYTLRVRKYSLSTNENGRANGSSKESNKNGNEQVTKRKSAKGCTIWYYACATCPIILPSTAKLHVHQFVAHQIPLARPLSRKVSYIKKLIPSFSPVKLSSTQPKTRKVQTVPHLALNQGNASGAEDGGSFTCKRCRSTFTSSWNLKVHMQTIHENSRPFECKTCGRSFKQRIHLIGHCTSTHSTVKAFRCDQCSTGFSKKWNLFDHVKKHHGANAEHLELLKQKYSKRRMKDFGEVDSGD